MKIICLVKFVPDTEQYEYDYETDKINREKSKLILNPDDRNALAWALQQKKLEPTTIVEVVSMGPAKTEKELKDFIRLGADRGVLISDRQFAGSDSLATSLVLSRYLSLQEYDLILTGTHTLDGGTGHVGPQIADLLSLNQFSNIKAIEMVNETFTIVTARQDEQDIRLKIPNPSVLSLTSQMNLRLGFVRYENIDKNVDAQFSLVTNETLNLSEDEVGRKGSPTKVRKNVVAKREKRAHQTVNLDDAGIEAVVQFLQEKGYL
ncbi:electron transfer flavoprotein subunit beta/FixA family protein [Enterococcus sp. BWR-S5]|uniref:electron transfer flavoprotein subunit beta/FixA family protein n=1 Tax=Enterococcus sp. BWR-S5 TaxID=2787714 RepID=UPI001922B31F|nr:electron transfer flavoprotein subunit beta/FixA family protein [Enterococcus sp. BWR-S5]MBL1224154.1 electron transfer flavoprotein subunit beta/FixA family protein [Enterococcus sp. BWR-S5]